MASVSIDKLTQAAKWIRAQLTARATDAHPSHLAAVVMAEADTRFELGSFGVEGHAFSPARGFQYLNYGDPYDPTIVVSSTRGGARVHVARGGWAAYAN